MPAFSAFLSIRFYTNGFDFLAAKHAKAFLTVWKRVWYISLWQWPFSVLSVERVQSRMAYLHSFAANGYLFCHVFCLLLCRMDKGKKRQETPEVFQNGHADKFRIACYEYIKRCQCICVAGIGTAMLFSGHAMWGNFMACTRHFCIYYQDQLMELLLLIMPGKTKATIESATGRDRLWEQILYFAAQKPMFGWGFACAERVVSVKGTVLSPDAHNNYIGFYGSFRVCGLRTGSSAFRDLAFFIFQKQLEARLLGTYVCHGGGFGQRIFLRFPFGQGMRHHNCLLCHNSCRLSF